MFMTAPLATELSVYSMTITCDTLILGMRLLSSPAAELNSVCPIFAHLVFSTN